MPHVTHKCPRCEYTTRRGGYHIRKHFKETHPEIDIVELEKSMILTRYPDLDLDASIQEYLEKKVTSWGLRKRGYDLIKYFRMIGILRPYGEEIVLARRLKHGSASVHDNPNYKKTMMEKYGVENPRKSQLINDKSLKKRLKNEGVEELFPVMKQLRVLKNARKSLRKALKDGQSRESDENIPSNEGGDSQSHDRKDV